MQETDAEVRLVQAGILLELLAQELQSLMNFLLFFLAIWILLHKERVLPVLLHIIVELGFLRVRIEEQRLHKVLAVESQLLRDLLEAK